MTPPTAPVPSSRTSPCATGRRVTRPPASGGALQDDEGDVVLVGETGAVRRHRFGHHPHDLLGTAGALLRDQVAEARLAELLVVGAARLADPVAVAQEDVAGPQLDGVRLVGRLLHEAQGRPALAERLD